jgi:hypothetical protein
MDDGTVNDFSRGYLSPQQHLSLKVEGGILAIAFSLLALGGVVIGAILLPSLIESRAQASSAYAREAAQTADREARVALEQTDKLRDEFHDYLGIKVPVKTALKSEGEHK